MRPRVRLICSTMIMLLAACTSVDRAVTFESFTSNGIEYEFGTAANLRGPEPCVRVTGAFPDDEGPERSGDGPDMIESAMMCPTEPSGDSGSATTINLRRIVFVLGFGLQEGESIVLPDAVRVLDTDSVDGRRFFLIQLAEQASSELAEQASSESFEVPITKPDGTVRFITTRP